MRNGIYKEQSQVTILNNLNELKDTAKNSVIVNLATSSGFLSLTAAFGWGCTIMPSSFTIPTLATGAAAAFCSHRTYNIMKQNKKRQQEEENDILDELRNRPGKKITPEERQILDRILAQNM